MSSTLWGFGLVFTDFPFIVGNVISNPNSMSFLPEMFLGVCSALHSSRTFYVHLRVDPIPFTGVFVSPWGLVSEWSQVDSRSDGAAEKRIR